MPRRQLLFQSGNHYHLYNRGVNRADVFFDDRNYHYFLHNINRYLSPVVNLVAYCLMPNHYHLLIFIPETSEVFKTSEVSRAMMRLSVSYTKTINIAYQRVGPLFQGQFQAKLVKNDAYLWHLVGYLHVNPVQVGLVKDPYEWQYSSIRDFQKPDYQQLIGPLDLRGRAGFHL